jgi:glycosyltransferase involved in cell wall biosynthesis
VHILFLHQSFSSRKDLGSGRANDFARCLAEAGHDVTCMAGTFDYLTGNIPAEYGRRFRIREQVDGYTVLRTWTYGGYHKSYVRRIATFLSFMVTSFLAGLAIRDCDVVVPCTPPFFLGLTGFALARWHRAPLVYEVRDLWSEVAFQLGIVRQPLIIWVVRRLERFLYRRAAMVVVNSPGFVTSLEAAGVPRERIVLIPNGVDLSQFRTGPGVRERVRQELGLGDKFVILYAGAHGLANDLGTILQTARLLQNRPDVFFIFVGDGKERPRLMEEAQHMGLGNVRFVGAQPKQRIPEFIAAADAGVATLLDVPLFRTTYPNKVFDYMAGARPTLLAIDGVIRDVVETARGGLFVKPGNPQALADAVLALRDAPGEARAMGQRARAYVEKHFDRRRAEEQMRDCLERVLMSGRQGAAARQPTRASSA